MAEVLIISGAGDYSDPWHRFGDTSLRLAEIIAGLGHQVTISDAVEKALADPGKPGLIVINIGNPCEARPQPRIDAAERGLDHHLLRGGALLGVQVSATSMTTMSRWSQMLGGHWVQGRTMHPKQDLFTVVVHDGAHPIVEGLSDFTVFDERYCYLHTNPDITVMCEQVTDGRLHPALETALSPMLRVSRLPVQSPGVGARSAAYLRGYRLRRSTSYGAPKVLSERSCWLPQVGPFCCEVLI